jgi:ABC-type sulfate transport system permease component
VTEFHSGPPPVQDFMARKTNKNHGHFKGRWVFPWVLAGIWGSWFCLVVLFFLLSYLNYRADSGSFVILKNGSSMEHSSWLLGNILVTAFLGAAAAVLACIFSVILYFFIPRPPSR